MWHAIKVFVVAAVICVYAAAAPTSEPSETQVGSDIELSRAIRTSDAVLVGTVISIEPPVPTAPGQGTYPSVVIRVEDALKGDGTGRDVTVSVIVRSIAGKIHEVPPELNRSYVFFVRSEGKKLSVLKVLPGDEKTVTEVRDRLRAPVASQATQPSDSAVDRLISRLRSETLKLEARERSVALTGSGVVKAKAAVDFMYDLKGDEVLLATLEMQNQKWSLKEYATEALTGLVSLGDIRAAEVALAQLEGSDVLIAGGSEVRIPQARYQRGLVRLINKATGKNFVVPELKGQFAFDLIPSEEIRSIAQSVDQWLGEMRVVDEKRGHRARGVHE